MTVMCVVASNTLRSSSYLDEMKDECIDFGDVKLLAIKERKWHQLRKIVIDLTDKHRPSVIRVAGHLNPCFGIDLDEWQVRFPKHEKELEIELQKDNGGSSGKNLDIQVWGFRHSSSSTIWNVLASIKRVSGEEADGEQKARFALNLINAFKESEVQSVYERLSIMKHRIIHLFLATKINLQIMEEARREGQEKDLEDKRAAEQTTETLQNRLLEASKLLNSCDDLVALGVENRKRAVAEILNNSPSLQTQQFDKWLYDLDNALNNLREAAVK